MVSRFLLLACLLLASPLWAKPYELTWRLKFDGSKDSALGSVTLGAGADQVRRIDFKLSPAYSDITGDGKIERKGMRVVWTPPRDGGSLSYRVKLSEKRKNGKYRSYYRGEWAIFRGDRVFPSARVRARRNASSRAKLILELPPAWHSDAPYLQAADGSFFINDAERRFDRPVGWLLVGEIGTRREIIADVEVALGAPKDQGMRRMDILAFLNFALPKMREALHRMPDKILIVSAPDPMCAAGSRPRARCTCISIAR